MDHDKIMVWTLALAAALTKGANAPNAANTADEALAEFDKRRKDGLFEDPSDRPRR